MLVPPPVELRALLDRSLGGRLHAALWQAVAVAEELGVPCYLVGGPVRDLLLGKPVDDLDLVLEGDAIAVAEQFAAQTGGKPTRHEAFGTASVSLGANGTTLVVDFVTARTEQYPEPAVLPLVQPSSIADDLHRRDFTINTLALRLHSQMPPELIDLCDGIPDLDRRVIRVLHDRSFVDDPTRILRGTRFAARLHFSIDQHTRQLIQAAAQAGMIERTSSARILHELWLTFREPVPQEVLKLLDVLGILPHVVPDLHWSSALAGFVAEARAQPMEEDDRRLLLLGLIAWALLDIGRVRLRQRYSFSAAEQRIIAESASLDAIVEALGQSSLSPSEIDRLLHNLTPIALRLAEIIASPTVARILGHYRSALQPIRTLLTGDDLRALAIPPGPRYRALLSGLRAAQLDGLITTRPEAERWVLEHKDV